MARQYFGFNGTFIHVLGLVIGVTLVMGLSACSGAKFLLQAAGGQFSLLQKGKPLQEVIADPKTPPRLARLLQEVPKVKAFGESQGLKPTRNYEEYVALNRPAAVWVVSACEKLKFVSKEWTFPIAGRFPYLGWFDLKAGQEYASELEKEGWDVDVRPAGAFSTLGWFRDPILSSMMSEGEEALGDLVNVILHESVHATFYIDGQAYFNESLASFVADRLVLLYLQGQTASLASYTQDQEQGLKRLKLYREAYQALATLYEQSLPDAQKLAQKDEILTRLMKDLGAKRKLTNAALVQFKTYATGEEEFARVLKDAGHWPGFWKRIMTLNEKSFLRPQQEDLGVVLKTLY